MVVQFPISVSSGNPGPQGPPCVAPDISLPGIDPTMFMDGSKHLIDFVFAYKPLKATPVMQEYRSIFEQKMWKNGLELEYQSLSESEDGKTCFLKIHAPWETLARIAEINRVKMPIQKSDLAEDDDSDLKTTHLDPLQEFFCCGKTPFFVEEELRAADVPTYFTLEFRRDQIHYYLNTDKKTFFPQNIRIQLVWDILQTITVSSDELTGPRLKGHRQGEFVGLSFLVSWKVFRDVFPLHDSDIKIDKAGKNVKPENIWPLRPWLYEVWARPGRWRAFQPLDQIREYFGEKVAMYFAWLGLYTSMLIPLSIFGLICFLYGVAIIGPDPVTTEVCDRYGVGNITICRTCRSETCQFQKLYKSCPYSVSSVAFHNKSTLPFAFFLTIWAILFLELWKRKQNRLACKWDTFDFGYEYEPPRPEYQATAKDKRRHPITREWEPYIPARSRLQNILFSLSAVTFLISTGIAIIIGVIIYKMIMVVLFYNWRQQIPMVQTVGSAIMATATGSAINACCIIALEQVYDRIAWILTEKEYPRTLSDFETSLAYKIYTFQFLNYYGLLFYLAFIQGQVASTPDKNTMLTDHCEPIGCTFSVTTQLTVILIVKQGWGNIQEILIPKLHHWWQRRRNVQASEDNVYTRFEKDYDLPQLSPFSLLPEYMEMVVQYGAVVLFGAAFPLAPLFALINNIIEIRVDAWKFVVECRRDVPKRACDIGTWYTILKFITRLSVFTNTLIVAFTTDIIDRMVYQLETGREDEEGFMAYSLSIFNTSDWHQEELRYQNHTNDITGEVVSVLYPECRFRGYYYPPDHPKKYERSNVWWHVMLAKVAFVVIFQNFIDWIQSVIQYLIPDIPEDVELHVQRNRYISKAAAAKFAEEQIKKFGRPPSTETGPLQYDTSRERRKESELVQQKAVADLTGGQRLVETVTEKLNP